MNINVDSKTLTAAGIALVAAGIVGWKTGVITGRNKGMKVLEKQGKDMIDCIQAEFARSMREQVEEEVITVEKPIPEVSEVIVHEDQHHRPTWPAVRVEATAMPLHEVLTVEEVEDTDDWEESETDNFHRFRSSLSRDAGLLASWDKLQQMELSKGFYRAEVLSSGHRLDGIVHKTKSNVTLVWWNGSGFSGRSTTGRWGQTKGNTHPLTKEQVNRFMVGR